MNIQNRAYPNTRLRRLRKQPWMRNLLQEHHLSTADLIWPLFVIEGDNDESIESMPGVQRNCLTSLLRQVEKAQQLGIPAIALFPSIDSLLKNAQGSEAWNADNLLCRTVRAVKSRFPDIGIIGDVALDPYTDHGQDGVIVDDYVHNDQSIAALIKQTEVQVEAGCDIIAPSDMMDGRIGAIRDFLEDNDQPDIHLMAYSAKYNSAFYGPFRDAVKAGGNKRSGGKETYQMNSANSDEALHEIALDIQEGADSIIVKPGMPYLDIIQRAKSTFEVPIFAYQVSGEYSMLCAAAKANMLNHDAVMFESLLAFKRAGATGIWTYFADQAAEKLSH